MSVSRAVCLVESSGMVEGALLLREIGVDYLVRIPCLHGVNGFPDKCGGYTFASVLLAHG